MLAGLPGVPAPVYLSLPGPSTLPTGRADTLVAGLVNSCSSSCLPLTASSPVQSPAMPGWLLAGLAAMFLGAGIYKSGARGRGTPKLGV
jgi:hypothetical protein